MRNVVFLHFCNRRSGGVFFDGNPSPNPCVNGPNPSSRHRVAGFAMMTGENGVTPTRHQPVICRHLAVIWPSLVTAGDGLVTGWKILESTTMQPIPAFL